MATWQYMGNKKDRYGNNSLFITVSVLHRAAARQAGHDVFGITPTGC